MEDKKMIIWDEEDECIFYGYVGEKTNMVDVYGEPIFVGDVVKITSKAFGTFNKSMAVYDEEEDKYFIMGIKSRCAEDGVITGWDVEKIIDHSNIEHSKIAKEVMKGRNFTIK